VVGMPRAKLYNVVTFEWVRRGVFHLDGGEISVWWLVSVTLDLSCFLANWVVNGAAPRRRFENGSPCMKFRSA